LYDAAAEAVEEGFASASDAFAAGEEASREMAETAKQLHRVVMVRSR
jgi:hypothetical protein